jgi:hypothetical protein
MSRPSLSIRAPAQNMEFTIKKKVLGRNFWLAVTLFFIFVFPVSPIVFGYGGEIFSLLVCLGVISLFSLKSKVKIFLPSYLICFFLLTLLLGALFRDVNNVIANDFLELFRPVFWLTIFTLFFGIFGEETKTQSLRMLTNFVLFLAVWGIAEVILPLPAAYSYIYRLPYSVYEGKAITSFIAPYAYAAVMGIGAIFFFARSKIQSRFKNLAFSVICIIAIFLSQSKSAIFGIMLVIPLMQMSYNKIVGIIIIVPFFIMLVSFFWLSGGLNYVTEFVANVASAYSKGGIGSLPGASPSIGNRVQQFQEMSSYLDPIFLFGRGIGKDYVYLESSFSLILFRYGISGFLILLWVFFATKLQLKSQRGRVQDPNWKSLNDTFSYLFIYFGIVSLSANLIDQFKVAFFYIGILGLLLAKVSAPTDAVISK